MQRAAVTTKLDPTVPSMIAALADPVAAFEVAGTCEYVQMCCVLWSQQARGNTQKEASPLHNTKYLVSHKACPFVSLQGAPAMTHTKPSNEDNTDRMTNQISTQ